MDETPNQHYEVVKWLRKLLEDWIEGFAALRQLAWGSARFGDFGLDD